MKKVNFLMAVALIIAVIVLSTIFLIGCNTPAPEKEEPKTVATVGDELKTKK
jgi:hypothetical protein